MADDKNRDLLNTPIELAEKMMAEQMESIVGQFTAGKPQRIRRVGELPAEPLVQDIANLVPEK